MGYILEIKNRQPYDTEMTIRLADSSDAPRFRLLAVDIRIDRIAIESAERLPLGGLTPLFGGAQVCGIPRYVYRLPAHLVHIDM